MKNRLVVFLLSALALLVLPSLAVVLFYALLVSFETRYAMPAYAIVVCLLVALAVRLARRDGGPRAEQRC